MADIVADVALVKHMEVCVSRTYGDKIFLVATLVSPYVFDSGSEDYENYQVIFADSSKDAVIKYDRLNHNCFYHGEVIEELRRCDNGFISCKI